MAENEGTVETAVKRRINSEIYWLVALFLLAASLRTIAALTRQMIGIDEASQLQMADNLLLGLSPKEITDTSSTAYGILYPLVTSFFAIMTRSTVVAGYITSILFGSLLILPPYLFGKVMWNRKVGTAAAALVAVLPVLVDNASLAGQQSIFAFWLGCGLFFGYRMQFTKRCLCGMLSGTCLGLAYLVDTSAVYFVIILFVMLVIIGLRQELASYATKAAVQFLVAFLIFAIPNVAWLTYAHGEFTVFNRPAEAVYTAVNRLEPGTIEYEQAVYGLDESGELNLYDLQGREGIFRTVVSQPWQLAKAMARTDYDFYLRGAQSLVPVWLLPLFGIGLFSAVWTRREALRYGYFLVILLPALIFPVVWSSSTFVLPFVMVLMVVTGKGWVYLEDWSSETMDEIAGWQKAQAGHKKAVVRALALVVLLPLAALSMWTVGRTAYPTEYRDAGEWLRDNGGEGARVMSIEAATAWYAEGTQVPLPYALVNEVVDYGRTHGAGYLVVSRRTVAEARPPLAPLMDGAPVAGLEEVYTSGKGSDEELIVYRVK